MPRQGPDPARFGTFGISGGGHLAGAQQMLGSPGLERDDVAFGVALARGVARDTASFGGRDAATEAFTRRYHAAGRRYLREAGPRGRASIVVDNNQLTQPWLVRPTPA